VAPDGGVWACAHPSHFIPGGKVLRYPMIWRVNGPEIRSECFAVEAYLFIVVHQRDIT